MGAPFIRLSYPLVHRVHPGIDALIFSFIKYSKKNMNPPEILAEYSHRQESRKVSLPEVGLEPTTSALKEQGSTTELQGPLY